MLRYTKSHTFEPVVKSDLSTNEILERFDLQKAICKSWQEFAKEIGMPDLYLIGSEIRVHESVRDTLDVLAFDSNDRVLVVIELKRKKNKLQLLQALSYAAMVSSWSNEQFIEEAHRQQPRDLEDIVDSLRNSEIQRTARVVLIAESFDPEVIITANWLYEHYNMDIIAYSISVSTHEDSLYFTFEQRYPLPELKDTFDTRGRGAKRPESTSEMTWEEVASQLQYSWGAEAIALCQNWKEGEPDRRRFGMLRRRYDGFDWISLNFRRKYLNVYIRGLPANAMQLLKSKFRSEMDIKRWRDGYSFEVSEEPQWRDLIQWLQLDKKH